MSDHRLRFTCDHPSPDVSHRTEVWEGKEGYQYLVILDHCHCRRCGMMFARDVRAQ